MKTNAINLLAAACAIFILSCKNADTPPAAVKPEPAALVATQPVPEPTEPTAVAETGFIQRPVSNKKRVAAQPQSTVDFSYQPNIAEPVVEQEPTISKVIGNKQAGAETTQSLYDWVASENTTTAQINSVFGGVVIGRQGTELEFPADAFELEDSSEYEGAVNIAFEEYFTKTDFILANLSSVSEGKLIESSGMFNITATTPDGKKLRLKKNKSASLRLPKNKKAKPGTTIFYGDHATAGNTPQNWALPAGIISKKSGFITAAANKKWRKLEGRIHFTIYQANKDNKKNVNELRSSTNLYVMRPTGKRTKENNLLKYVKDKDKYNKYFTRIMKADAINKLVQTMVDMDTLKLAMYLDAKGRLLEVKANAKTMETNGTKQIENSFKLRKKFQMAMANRTGGFYFMYMVKRTITTSGRGAGTFDRPIGLD